MHDNMDHFEMLTGGLNDCVHQASGMIAAHRECDPSEALGRLRIRAAATGRSLEEMAHDVLDGNVDFRG